VLKVLERRELPFQIPFHGLRVTCLFLDRHGLT
jgi:hypothetical protein